MPVFRPFSVINTVPCVGIYCSLRVIEQVAAQNPPEAVTLNIDAAQKAGVLAYVFSINDVDFRINAIFGWIKDRNGTWVRHEMPWPHILYDRGAPFDTGEKRKANRVKNLLRSTAIPINTTRALPKDLCYAVLRRYRDVYKLMPETVVDGLGQYLKYMTHKYRHVLAKPLDGQAAMGISRIWSGNRGRYGWESALTGEKVEDLNPFALRGKILGEAKNKRFLLQRQIDLLQIDGQRCDIRVLMCKGSQGKWQDVQNHVWLFNPDREDMWVRKNCVAFDLADCLQTIAPEKSKNLLSRILGAAYRIVGRLDANLGSMGEIGLDFALDTKLGLWFLEANAMPDKDPEPCDPKEYPPKQFIAVYDYAKYIAKHRGLIHQ